MNEPKLDPFDERQTWWWRILTPLLCAVACVVWSLIGLSNLEERQHQDLYALLAHADSAGTGEIHWKPGGEHHAFMLLNVPFWCGVGSMLICVSIGSVGMWRAGWLTVIGYWLFGLFCTAGFAAFMGWLWINAVGVFI